MTNSRMTVPGSNYGNMFHTPRIFTIAEVTLHMMHVAHVTQHRWHFWCTEMAPSGKESALATFKNFQISDGPADSSDNPMFPEDKKKEFASRRDTKLMEKDARTSTSKSNKDCCKNGHNFVPHFANKMVCRD